MRSKYTICLVATLAGAFITARAISAAESPGGATNLTLAPDLSFTDDSSANFPIRGVDLGAGELGRDVPTVVFFGTSHCFNTNREAERFVAFAARHRENARFLVVDLDHPSASQRALVRRFYRGYIPTLAFVAPSGRVAYDKSGETSSRRGDTSKLEEILAGAIR